MMIVTTFFNIFWKTRQMLKIGFLGGGNMARRRKSVGFTFVDADFRHLQTKLVGLRANHTDDFICYSFSYFLSIYN